MSVPPLGALSENQAAHWCRHLPSPGGPVRGARRPRGSLAVLAMGPDEMPCPRVPDIPIFFRAIGCYGSKENMSPLSHGAAGIFLCLSLAGKKGKKKKSDRVLGPAKRRRGPPRSPVSPYPHPKAWRPSPDQMSVPQVDRTGLPRGPVHRRGIHGSWLANFGPRSSTPHPCPRAKRCRSQPFPCPKAKPSTPLMFLPSQTQEKRPDERAER